LASACRRHSEYSGARSTVSRRNRWDNVQDLQSKAGLRFEQHGKQTFAKVGTRKSRFVATPGA
jgi:hypothetical protein